MRVLNLLVAIAIATSTLSASAQEPTTTVEDVKLTVKFTNGSSTTRKGANGLKEVDGYNPELIQSINYTTNRETSGEVMNRDTIVMILDYVKAKEFSKKPPFATTPKRERIYSAETTKTIIYRSGEQKTLRGYEINEEKNIDYKSVESIIFNRGMGIVTKTTYSADNGYRIMEVLKDDEVGMVKLETRKHYILEGGEVIVTLKTGKVKRYDGLDIAQVTELNPTTISKIEVIEPQKSTTTDTPKKKVEFYDLSRDQIWVVNKDDFKYETAVAYRRGDHTEVDFIFPIFYSKQWFSTPSKSYIIDPKSGERYQVLRDARGIPMDRYIRVIDQVGQSVVLTSIYPAIPEGIKKINILDYQIEGMEVPSHSNGNGPWLIKGIKVLDEDTQREYKDIR